MPKIWKSASLAAALTATACAPLTMPAGATEGALCRTWGEGLPTRSRADTVQTQDEIAALYADFTTACPAWAELVP